MSLRVLGLSNTEKFASVYSKGFRYTKQFTDPQDTFFASFIVGYFDLLIISMHLPTSYTKFLKDRYLINSLIFLKPKESEILNKFLQRIETKSITFDDFLLECKKDPNLISDLIGLSKALLNSATFTTLEAITPNLNLVSRTLNIQFAIYESNSMFTIRNNKYCDPLVINLLKYDSSDSVQFFPMYHEDFKVISIQNHNTSNFFVDIPDEEVEEEIGGYYIIEEILRILAQEMERMQISKNDRSNIRNTLGHLLKGNVKNWSFANMVERIGMGYSGGRPDCDACKENIEVCALECGHRMCGDCLELSKKSGACSSCKTKVKFD